MAPILGLPEPGSPEMEDFVNAMLVIGGLLQVILWFPVSSEVYLWIIKRKPEWRTDGCYYPLVIIGSILAGTIPGLFFVILYSCCISGKTT
ncbi:hypothetical protein QBC38DRAFT_489823 [Podospora fimiseda]|uniref:Uncharacterized protein n=1 Tax=Podospora fimiseda TaxID=252190 RepID=A0AAN7BFN0_9PEZI|nr:hypothetical protein QBC38DRAFT_489823 [Podospora fimiseda]